MEVFYEKYFLSSHSEIPFHIGKQNEKIAGEKTPFLDTQPFSLLMKIIRPIE